MAKHKQESAAHTLDELETLGDKLATWAGENVVLVIGTAAAILIGTAAYVLVSSSMDSSRAEASAELAQVQISYREAMGAAPEDLVVLEPANAETGRRVREEYIVKFAEVATAREGTTIGALASLEVGALHEALGDDAAALEIWQGAADSLDAAELTRALLLERVAAVHESAERWTEAAEAHLAAADVADFPLRYGSLADAARCFADAGDVDRAFEAFARVEEEAPDVRVPEHVTARIRELRIAQELR